MLLKLLRNLAPSRQDHGGERATLLTALFSLSWIQLAQLFSGWLAQTCDSIDMFNISLNAGRLERHFHLDGDVAMKVVCPSLNYFFRIFGAFLVGIASDRLGRKWPLVAILLFSSLLQFGTGFTQSIEVFLLLRSVSGLAMGGVWGIAVSNAMENLPFETRGLASGILAQGYAVGYLVSSIMSTYLVAQNRYTWRVLFWAGSGMMAFAAIVRAVLPESQAFLSSKARKESQNRQKDQGYKAAIREAGRLLKTEWKTIDICVGVVANINSSLHGSQDLYPTYLEDAKGFTVRHATITAIVGSCGAIVGGVVAGSLSQVTGRRLTMLLFLLLGAAFIPLSVLPSIPTRLRAGVFLVQFGVQGASGVVPIWLAELSPPGLLAFFPGFIAQVGNMLGAGAGESVTLMAGANGLKKTRIINGNSTVVPGYETAMCIITGISILLAIVFLIIAPESLGSHFAALNAAFDSEESGFNDHTPPRPRLSSGEEKQPHVTGKDLNLEVDERLL